MNSDSSHEQEFNEDARENPPLTAHSASSEDPLSSEQSASTLETDNLQQPQLHPEELLNSSGNISPLIMVETAFLASAASLIWLFNYYFPLGPVLQVFFPVPIALIYLRWGSRASWMAALVSGLLLSILMGPSRSILFFIPYGLMGVQLGALWRRQAKWSLSIFIGGLVGAFGFFFRFWLLSLLLGEDLWAYLIGDFTTVVEWIFVKLGWLQEPNLFLIEAIAITAILLNNLLYVFVVHLVSLLVLDRLGNPIPRPPAWIEIMLDYDS